MDGMDVSQSPCPSCLVAVAAAGLFTLLTPPLACLVVTLGVGKSIHDYVRTSSHTH